MAAKQDTHFPVHMHCMQHSRFTKQDGWRLYDLSLSLSGNIAVTGDNVNTDRTSLDVYSPVRNSDSRDKPKIFYSKEFDKYEDERKIYRRRRVSFVDSYDDNRGLVVVTGLGDKLEVFDLNQDRVLKSRKVTLVNHGWINCLSVREREIFIGFLRSNKITVCDVTDLNEIKSIILKGFQDGDFPFDMTAVGGKLFVSISNGKEERIQRSLIFDEKNGTILSELTNPTDTRWYAFGITVCVPLGVVAVAWTQTYKGTSKGSGVILFYSQFSPNNSSFLIVEIEFGVSIIRISDRGDRMVTMNGVTGEVKVYDMAEFCTYNHFKENLILQLQQSDLLWLKDYFALPEDQWDIILKSEMPAENLLLALEVRGSMELSSVDRLTEAFDNLKISPSCNHLVLFYRRTRIQTTSYDTFLASLSAHLTASLPADLCDYFNLSDEEKSSITSSQNPGLSLLLALNEKDVITPSDIGTLEQPFSDFKLVQALAKVHEFQSLFKEESQSQTEAAMTNEGKREFFIQCLRRKIKSWFDTMTPVPWKKSCKWKSTDMIIIRKLSLADNVISANKDVVTFNSGVTMKTIHTLRMIEISRWDQTLKDEDYKGIVKFISTFRLLAEAKLYFPSQPPDLDKETLIQVAINNKRVMWSIGPRVSQTLDIATGLWQFQSIIAPLAGIRQHQDPQNVGLEAEAVISREGGKLEIPNTGVQLNVPPDAFEEDIDQCLLKMRIILPGIYHTTATSFTSNTSTVVELLPNNLRLKQTAILTIPHCLELGVDRGDGSYTAKIFITHHEKGHAPVWKEQPNLLYYLGSRKCLIWLDSFCWVKYEVNGAVVEGKKLQVYAAGEPHVPGDDVVETEVGYYPDLPGGGEILRNNKSLILSQQKPFIFLKEQQLPLTLSLLTIKPSSWIPFEQSQEIPFQSIAADCEEHSCPFIFENKSQVLSPPVLIFRVFQGDRNVKLRLRPQAAEKMVHYQREEEHMSSEESLLDCFLFLKRNLVRDWKDLGRYLRLSEAELGRVSCDNKDDVGESMYQMLIKWQQENGPRATRTKLVEALEKLGRKDLIQNLPY